MNALNTAFVGLAVMAGIVAAGPARAANELVIVDQSNVFNKTDAVIEGDGNRLRILQQGGTADAHNGLEIGLFGDGNGGPLDASFRSAALEPGLMPGTIEQAGFGNAIALTVTGNGNLFAFAQLGNHNTISGAISGQANQAVVLQEGANNHSGFSQSGIGNIISIVQRSW